MLCLPESVSAKMLELAGMIPDEELAAGGRELEPHITILYGITGVDAATVVSVVRKMESPLVTFGLQSVFSAVMMAFQLRSRSIHRPFIRSMRS